MFWQHCVRAVCASLLVGFISASPYEKTLLKQLVPGCNNETYTMPGFEFWLHLDTVNCLIIYQNSATFCSNPTVPSGTINGTGPSYSIAEACCACPSPSPSRSATPSKTRSPTSSPSTSATASTSRTPSSSQTSSTSPSKSLTSSVSPSHSLTPSITPTISITPTTSPSPSLTPATFSSCLGDKGAIRCPFEADSLVWPVHISNAGTLVSVIGESGFAEFNFTNTESIGGSLWLRTRCQNGASDSWIINGNVWFAQHSTDFVWQEVGPLSTTTVVRLQAREPNCEILAVYVGQDGANLGTGALVDDCSTGPARGYLCPTQMQLSAPVEYDLLSDAIASTQGLPGSVAGAAVLNFYWNEQFGQAGLWFYTNCAGSSSDSWLVNGTVWDVPWSNDGQFHWNRYGSVSDPRVVLVPQDANCRIRFAYLGLAQPDVNAIPDCPLDEAKCPSEGSFQGFHLQGITDEDIYGDCNGNVDSGYETSSCFGQVTYEWGSNRGSLWAYVQCPSEEENSWFVNSVDWNLETSSSFGWQEFGNVECGYTVLDLHEKNCHIGMLFRGYNEPYLKDCTCPWNSQGMFVLEGIDGSYGSLQEFDSRGSRVGVPCATGFLGAKQVTQDRQGNMYVTDSIAGKIFRVAADCSSKIVISEYPASGLGSPTAIAIGTSDTQLFVSDASTGLVWRLTLSTAGTVLSRSTTPFPSLYYRSLSVSAEGIVYAAGQNYVYYWDTASGGTTVHTLVNPAIPVVDVSDVFVSPYCPGLYFTADDNNQVWYCSSVTDASTCSRFCSEFSDGSSCVGLSNPSGASVDCQCQLYVTSYTSGTIVRYDGQGRATILASNLVMPTDVMFRFDDSIYSENCCHTPLPTPTVLVNPNTGDCCADNSIVYFIENGDVYQMAMDGSTMTQTSDIELFGAFLGATDIELDGQGGLFVIDNLEAAIYHVSSSGNKNLLTKWPMDPIAQPRAILMASTGLYVVDSGTHKVWFISLYADYSVASITDTELSNDDVVDIAMGPEGNLYLNVKGNQIIYFDTNFQTSTTLLTGSIGVVDINDFVVTECGLFMSANDNNQVWFCSDPKDSSTCQVYCNRNMGQDGSSCYDLMNPTGVAVDCSCNLYVVNHANGKLVGYSGENYLQAPHNDINLYTGQFLLDVEVDSHSCPPTRSFSASTTKSLSITPSITPPPSPSASLSTSRLPTPSPSPSISPSPFVVIPAALVQCNESLAMNNTGTPTVQVAGCTINSIAYVDTQTATVCDQGGGAISRDFTINATCGTFSVTQQILISPDIAPPMPVPRLNVTCCDPTETCGTAGYYEFDDCDEHVVVSFTDVITDGCYDRTLNRTWTACDCSNNCVSKSQIIVFAVNRQNNAP